MPALLDGYPKVRATFNLVPSLLAQIEDYGKAESVDLFLNLSQRAAGDLSGEERDFVLRWMRESPRALRVQQSPRYLELASRAVDAQFTMADIRDLQVWFNLAWCDPVWVENDRGLAEQARLDWMISDEEVLSRSIEGQFNRDENLYQPKRVAREGGSVSMVFRDSQLSNVIGFDYQRTSSVDAARDLIGRLRRIRDVQGDRDFLAVIALDGENAWEFYPRDGHDFLNALYTELESSADVVTTTVSDFLAEHPPLQQLHHLHTGSWIGASLDTWIGDPEHNVAWDLLAETRDWLDAQSQQRPRDSQQAALAWRATI